VAVRSSSMDEDGAGASFAGIHETRLAVPLEGLADAVAAVARSPLAPRARAYREQLGLRPASEPCAVVVQVMVDASCAGVAFRRGSNEVVIEAVEGLGEVAMSGEAVLDDSAALLPGGVLVAYATDPAWTPLFARAAGIVVELGGLLSHAATVAREYGIPCVSNVEGATELLRDGDLVRVDGSRGVVVVVSRARPET